jgi:hypothetical protein
MVCAIFILPYFPKVLLQWEEPTEFLSSHGKTRNNRARARSHVMLAIAVIGFSICLWALPGPQNRNLAWYFLVGFGILGELFLYAYPRLYRTSPSVVKLCDKSVLVTKLDITHCWEHRHLCSYSWIPEESFSILALNHIRGDRLLVGVPKWYEVTPIDVFFKERGIPLEAVTGVPLAH